MLGASNHVSYLLDASQKLLSFEHNVKDLQDIVSIRAMNITNL